MRIRLSLKPLQYPAALTTDHHRLAAFLYQMLEAGDPALSQWLHNEGMATQGRPDKRYKPLCFGVPECPRYHFQHADKVFSGGVVYWQISSPLEEVIAALLAGLATHKTLFIGCTVFTLTEALLLPPLTFESEMRFIALAPLTASVHLPGQATTRSSKVYLRDEAEFGDAITTNLRWKYLVLTGQESTDTKLQFIFDQDYLQHCGGWQSRQITRLVSYGTAKIKAYAAPFIVRGDPALLSVGWDCGFGESNAQGFGMAGLG